MIFDLRLGSGFVPLSVVGTDRHTLTGFFVLFFS